MLSGAAAVLSIGKLGSGQETYYLTTVAAGVEDYYLGSGEAPGRWTGSGLPELDLGGEVEAEQLRVVLGGVDPRSGERLCRASGNRSPGFDLTFSAPKSVSLLYALGDRSTAGEVVDAHERAVDEALSYLETHAVFTRHRRQGALVQARTHGLIVAAFRHRTSRAGDPQLHTHCLVANLVRSVEGPWRTLDSRSLYHHAKTAGFVYQAVLRSELTRRLGVAWGDVRKGMAEVEGVEPGVLRAFSRRREEIEAALEERGASSREAARTATLDTRKRKDYDVNPAALRERWGAEALAAGLDPERLGNVLRRDTPPAADLEPLATTMAGPTGLTLRRTTFEHRDVVQAWCAGLPPGAPVDVAHLDRLTRSFLARSDVVRLVDGKSGNGGRARYSTTELLAVEQHLIDRAVGRQHQAVGVVRDATVEAALSQFGTLADEQRDLVVHLTGAGHGVDVVVGKAGTGKTTALAAARAAWEADGFHVIGAALAARAAGELQDGAGISSTTIARLLLDLERPDRHLGSRTVLVVDEAGMVDTRRLARLLDHAEAAGAKVVLVGDHRQLPEIEAGGAFAGLAHRLDGVELTRNRRQHHDWERTALDRLRHGDVAEAVAAYRAHDRVAVLPSSSEAQTAMVNDWLKARANGEQVLMLAATNEEVDGLNRLARRCLQAAGEVGGAHVETERGCFAAGDEIVCLRNDRRIGVVNGTRGTVLQADPDRSSLTIESGGRSIQLPPDYLAEHVAHGYALTIHKAQGVTADRALLLASDALYREAGYVALSRGRRGNHLYTTADDAALVSTLRDSAAQRLALDELADDRERLRHLWRRHDELLAQLPPAPPDPTAQILHLKRTRRDLAEQADAAAAACSAARQKLESLPRRWTKRRRAEHEAARREVQTRTEGHANLRRELARVDQAISQREEQGRPWLDWMRRYEPARAELRQLEQEIWRTASAAAAAPSDDVYRAIGPPPPSAAAGRDWRTAAAAAESYFARAAVTPDPKLGADADAQNLQQLRNRLQQQLTQTAERTVARSPDRGPDLGISL